MNYCIHCRGILNNIIDLKEIPIVNNFVKNKINKKIKTKISICKKCKLFQHENILKKMKHLIKIILIFHHLQKI